MTPALHFQHSRHYLRLLFSSVLPLARLDLLVLHHREVVSLHRVGMQELLHLVHFQQVVAIDFVVVVPIVAVAVPEHWLVTPRLQAQDDLLQDVVLEFGLIVVVEDADRITADPVLDLGRRLDHLVDFLRALVLVFLHLVQLVVCEAH